MALAIPLTMASASTVWLDVNVENVRDGEGHVLVAVCPRADFLSPHCPYVGKAIPRPGTVRVRVEGIPPGVYAVQAFQDSNDNMEIDRNFLGLPTEGIGFSNDAPFRFGPPRFADAAVRIGSTNGAIVLRLRYLAD